MHVSGFKAVLAAVVLIVSASSAAAQTGTPRPASARSLVSQEVAFEAKEAARQLDLFQAAVAELAPQRPGVPDVYVLSLSLWDDPVFENEASQAAKILAGRFHAQGRTLVLSAGTNGPARTLPAASPFFIQAALARIGAILNPEEDVLVLFMTSHGNRDGSIALQERRRLMGLWNGRQLRTALDEVGIKHRLVIVSACFSGAFVSPLASDTTIVFTAASSTQTSFGCQPDREWTYFGDAFVRQQLSGSVPLMDAFEAAKATILSWERRDGYEPSNPQRFVGAQTRTLLAALGER